MLHKNHRFASVQYTKVGSHSLLQRIFLSQGSNPGLLYCRQILYCLSHQGALVYVYVYLSLLYINGTIVHKFSYIVLFLLNSMLSWREFHHYVWVYLTLFII